MARTPAYPIEPLIAINDPELLKLWAERFGVEVAELKRAARTVGCAPDDLQEELTGIPALSRTLH